MSSPSYKYRNPHNRTEEEREQILQERIARGFPAHAPPHPFRRERYYFLTAACFLHNSFLSPARRRNELTEELFKYDHQGVIDLRAWVILRNHYHLLARVHDFEQLSKMFNRIHGKTSFTWNEEDNTRGRKVWYRYTDRAIRSERHYYTTLNYIHYNPVKHNVVSSPYLWDHSSVHWFKEKLGREWLRQLWVDYPVMEYGKGWDDIE